MRTTSLPPLLVSADDWDRLADLAAAARRRMPEVADCLMAELDRAEIVEGQALPPDVVAMGSAVDYEEAGTGRRRSVRLVYPVEADLDAGRVSVLTPVGTALLGLRRGARFGWQARSGERRELRVLEVAPPA